MTQTATIPMTINLPTSLVRDLETTALRHQRTLSAVVRDLLMREQPFLPSLPHQVEDELTAMSNLSDETLWLLARSTLTKTEQEKLATLNQRAKENLLTTEEQANQDALLMMYNQTMIRRAQAASLLKIRGYDLSDPAVLQQQ